MNARRRHASPSIARFALLSLAAHVSLLVAWQHPMPFAGQPDSVLSVVLTDATQPPTPAQASTTPRLARLLLPESQSAQHEQTSSVAGIRQTNANQTASTTADKHAADADGSGTSPELARAHLQAQLLTDLARHFDYPDSARRRGWEGMVLLGLYVEPDGRLNKIHIERSSGHAVLDDSALNSLKRLGNLAEARVWLAGRSIDMQLPVIYRLIDN